MIEEAASFFNPGGKGLPPLFLSLHSDYVPPSTILWILNDNKINSLRDFIPDKGISS
jgi:hypothetical protein